MDHFLLMLAPEGGMLPQKTFKTGFYILSKNDKKISMVAKKYDLSCFRPDFEFLLPNIFVTFVFFVKKNFFELQNYSTFPKTIFTAITNANLALERSESSVITLHWL